MRLDELIRYAAEIALIFVSAARRMNGGALGYCIAVVDRWPIRVETRLRPHTRVVGFWRSGEDP